MIQKRNRWTDFLSPNERLIELYGAFSDSTEVTVQSIHINRAGPTLYMRVDLPNAPAVLPQELIETGCNRIQISLEFLAVDDFTLTGSAFPSHACMTAIFMPDVRARFHVEAEGLQLDFTAHQQVRAGHLSVYQSDLNGVDDLDVRQHYFLGKVDARLFNKVPDSWIETFHGRL
jgi:hypothetical protein